MDIMEQAPFPHSKDLRQILDLLTLKAKQKVICDNLEILQTFVNLISKLTMTQNLHLIREVGRWVLMANYFAT